jgi:crotonobetainyl-CoA:carnitine CoA-transferase CaiB-like acyl-CoA transferase
VPAGEVLSVPEVLAQAQIEARAVIRHFDHAEGIGRPLDLLRAGFRTDRGVPAPGRPPPEHGADNALILKELGYDQDAIGELKRLGVI